MPFHRLTMKQLNSLVVPQDQWSLERRLLPMTKICRGKSVSVFETAASCCAEDVRRARAIESLPAELAQWKASSDFEKTKKKLVKALINEKEIPATLASARCMRDWRLRFLGATFQLIQTEHRQPFDGIAFFVFRHPRWTFTPENWT